MELTKFEEKGLLIPNKTLELFGCRNCVWKSNGQCPKGFTRPEESVPEGYCSELGEFMLSLAGENDNVTNIQEKFHIYTQQVQAMADGSEYRNAQLKLNEFREKEDSMRVLYGDDGYKQKLGELQMEVTSSKIWWSRLTDAVVKALGKIADRESRSKDVKGLQKVTVQQLNVLLRESDEELKKIE